jgi:hypothetical protein
MNKPGKSSYVLIPGLLLSVIGLAGKTAFGASTVACPAQAQSAITISVKEVHAKSEASNDTAWILGSGSFGGTVYQKFGVMFYLPSESPGPAGSASSNPYDFTNLNSLRVKQAGQALHCFQIAQEAFATGQKMQIIFHGSAGSLKARVTDVAGVCTQLSVMTPTGNDVIAPADCVLSKY